jgi:hypothetical protein
MACRHGETERARLVGCPVCGKLVPSTAINEHLDHGGCLRQPAQRQSLVNSKASESAAIDRVELDLTSCTDESEDERRSPLKVRRVTLGIPDAEYVPEHRPRLNVGPCVMDAEDENDVVTPTAEANSVATTRSANEGGEGTGVPAVAPGHAFEVVGWKHALAEALGPPPPAPGESLAVERQQGNLEDPLALCVVRRAEAWQAAGRYLWSFVAVSPVTGESGRTAGRVLPPRSLSDTQPTDRPRVARAARCGVPGVAAAWAVRCARPASRPNTSARCGSALQHGRTG